MNKNLYILLLYFTISALAITLNACKKDPCKKINCGYNGSCYDGKCQCYSQYEGEFCELKKDLCKDMICQNGSDCTDGACICTPGYEGMYCESKMSAKFIGYYSYSEICARSTDTTSTGYIINISADASILTIIYIHNIKNSGAIVKANIYGAEFEIPVQAYPGNLIIHGNGRIQDNKLILNYTIQTNNSSPDITQCSGEGI